MTITLLAHGSPDARHARDVAGLSARLKLAGLHAQVAYLDHHAPSPADAARALAGGNAPATTVVPLMVNPAYQARVDVPAAARAMQSAAPEVSVALADPVGLHPTLLDACAELAEASALDIDDRTGIILACGGSRDVRAVALTEDLVRRNARALLDRLGARSVRAAYLEGGRPMGCVRTLLSRVDGCTSFVVLTAVIADGALRDRMVTAASRHDLPVATGTLATTNALADLVVLRAGSAPAPHAAPVRVVAR